MRGMAMKGAGAALWVLWGSCWLAAQNPAQPETSAPPAQARQGGQPATPAAEAAAGAPPVAVDPNRFTLGPEDIVAVRVWREPDLSGVVVVRPDGKISMPLINEVEASGLTPAQLGVRLSEVLSKFINNPQVSVVVQAVRSKRYMVTGEVNRPGAYPLAVSTTVFDALTLAGGFREFASRKKITIVRGPKRIRFNYNEVVRGKNLEQNIQLENGDQIIVP